MTTKDEALKQALEWIEAQPEPRTIGAAKVVQSLRAALAQKDEQEPADDLREIILRREAVIKVLERDAHEALQRASNAIGTRKVLWNLLGECSPLLHQLECDDAESEDRLCSLLQRIDDARSVVQAEELPGAVIAKATGEQT